MKQSFSDQLSMWRTSNGIATMKEVLKNNTTVVEKDGKKFKIVRPHAHIKTNNIKVLGAYVKFKIELIKLVGRMRVAVDNDDAMEFELLKQDISKMNKKFFNAIRKATGYENFMAIDHENALTIEDGEKVLTIHLFPMKANGSSFNFTDVEFKDENGEKTIFPCMVIVDEEPKRKHKHKRNKKVKK